MRIFNKSVLNVLTGIKKFTGNKTLLPISKFRPEGTEKILAISCTAIGDTLFATPAIKALISLMPHASVDLLVRDRFADLFQNQPGIRKILLYRGQCRGALNLMHQIRKNRYGLCLIFHDSDPCPVQASYLAGIPFIARLGQRDESVARFLSTRISYRPESHAIEQRLDIIRKIFKVRLDEPEDKKMVLPVSNSEAERFWKEKMSPLGLNYYNSIKVGFQFSASGVYKTWPAENFVLLGKCLMEGRKNMVIALFGGPKEKKRAKKLISSIAGTLRAKNRVINFAGDIRIKELPAALKGLDLFVTNDTGPFHAAIGVQTPTISLFVPTMTNQIGPIQDIGLHTVIKKAAPCSPCLGKYCKNPHCMSLITVNEVYEAALSSLSLS